MSKTEIRSVTSHHVETTTYFTIQYIEGESSVYVHHIEIVIN